MAKRADTSAAAGAPAKTVPSRHRLPFAVWFRRFGWRHVVGILGALFALFPVAWVVSAAFNPLGQLSTNTSIIPEGVTLQRRIRDMCSSGRPQPCYPGR